MNKIWLQVFGVMIGGSLLKSFIPNVFVWIGIDLAVFGLAYLILRRDAAINLKSSMIFLGGLTFVSILTDLRMVSDIIGSIMTLALLGWMMYNRGGNNGSNPPNLRHKWDK